MIAYVRGSGHSLELIEYVGTRTTDRRFILDRVMSDSPMLRMM